MGGLYSDIVIFSFQTISFDFDFYLQAHAGLQGTVHLVYFDPLSTWSIDTLQVKPTHYTVVYVISLYSRFGSFIWHFRYDELKLTADELQQVKSPHFSDLKLTCIKGIQ